MKENLFRWLLVMTLVGGASACQNEDDPDPVQEEVEYQHLRLLISDEVGKEISLVNPRNGEVSFFEAKFPKSAVYATEAGRFGALVHTQNNLLEVFDTGLEGHGDHVDVKGTAKFAALLGESAKPTHFKSKGDEIFTFNDGDGSMSVAKEGDFHTINARMSRLETGNVAHHGAMAKFDNGTYAVTEKDGSIVGSLPERVKIIDGQGKLLHQSTLATGGIHGNAGNGEFALFGSVSGVLVVDAAGDQRLIAHPEQFGSKWLSTIIFAKGANQFLGYSSQVGVYSIDVDKGTMGSILESDQIVQAKVDYSGNSLIVLFYDGSLQTIDLVNNTTIKKAQPIPSIDQDDTQKPQLEATSRFIYITQPRSGELLQVSRSSLKVVSRLKTTSTPYRLAILGLETDAGH